MLAGTSRSPAAISAPASASAFTAAFAGSRTSTRTGTSRSRSSRTASEPTFPAVVTRITVGLSSSLRMGYRTHFGKLGMGCQTQKLVS